ncbi:MAG: ComEC/Rec2 family competence protein, partial [Peptococcaceae bacterium]|nr:ComEC/Rec2 family competence protein [Peptococcaceae bacterium]
SVGLWVSALILLFVVRALLWKPRDYYGRILQPWSVILCFCFLTGFCYAWAARDMLPEPLRLDQVNVIGTLLEWRADQDQASGVIRLEAEVSMEPENIAGGRYRISVYPDSKGDLPAGWDQVEPGDILRFNGRLEQPLSAGTPGSMDLRVYYAVRGLNGSIIARGEADCLQTGRASFSWRVRRHVHQVLTRWPAAEGGVLEGILFGDSRGIPSALQEAYKVTGVLHVFAASGSNVAFILLLSWSLLRWAPRRVRILLCIGALIFYALLCGNNAPVIRATILGVATLAGRWFNRGHMANMRWLGFAALALFVKNPLILLDVGFQLSFTAAWGISVLAPRLDDCLGKKARLQRLPASLRQMLAVTLAAQAATLPIMIYAFHRLSLIALLTNIGILLVFSSVFELGMIGVLLSFWPPLAYPLFQTCLWLLRGVQVILARLAVWPWADVWVIDPGTGLIVFCYACLLAIPLGRERLRFMWSAWLRRGFHRGLYGAKRLGLPARRLLCLRSWFDRQKPDRSFRWAIVVLLIVLVWRPWGISRSLELSFIDVGQGDSILIKTAQGSAVLVDTGPRTESYDAGERIVVPYLLYSGVKELTWLILTHEDSDHIGGAGAVLANIPVERIGVPAVGERLMNDAWQEGLTVNGRVRTDLHELRVDERIMLGPQSWLEVLAPNAVLEGTRSDPNNNSLVLRLHHYDQTVLLTGDIEDEEMDSMLEAQYFRDWEADFLKQPHHGSKYSLNTDWLEGIHPQAVLICVGRNTFGHPSPEVMAYWAERGVPVYQTLESGTIRLYLDPGSAELRLGR